MAEISTDQNIKNLLKTYYKDGVENLMFRNSPVVKEITKERVEGKEQAFSAMVGRGGAVGGNYKKAKAAAATVAETAEFKVTPGQLFSVYTMNAKEVQASKTLKGAYAPIAGAKMFAATEAFRKTIASIFYGSGYGELCHYPVATQIKDGTEYSITLPTSAIMAIDNGSVLVVKTQLEDSAAKATLTVTSIDGNSVTVMPKASSNPTPSVSDWICLDGSVNDSGKPTLPVGLGGWLPTFENRTGENWKKYIKKDFFNVVRAKNPDRLAGAFYDGSKDKDYKSVIENLIMKCRRQGSVADMIIMNDKDFQKFAAEIETTNTFMTQTSTKGKKEATVGFSNLAAAFSTNYIENIYDDPYCPEGKVFVLDREYVRLWSYTNMDLENDGVAGNEAGKPDVMEAGANGNAEKPYGLIIDDYLNVKPGDDTDDGPATMVSLLAYFSFVITNPSTCGVALLPVAGK